MQKPIAKSLWLWTGGLLLGGSVAVGVLFAQRPQIPLATAASTSAKPQDRMLEMLGSLSAVHLYQSYLNIGFLADAVESEGYTVQEANEMLSTVVGLMTTADRQLAKVAKMDLSEEDRQDVEQIQEVSALLKLQVASLRAYWLTRDSQLASRYQVAREKAWAALGEVLGWD